ncbi:MAG: hypothetical protein ACRDK2_05230 [Solirubrobacteraceae bacterium]
MALPSARLRPPAQNAVGFTISVEHPGTRVPRDFLGLSFEASALPLIARYGAGGTMARMLRSLGDGVLRFGGVTSDTQTAWSDARAPRPAWASTTIDRADLVGLRRLARASGWRIALTVGLAHFEPDRAAREVRAAKKVLGGWLAGVELGNEPDAYGRHGLRPEPWTLARYDANVSAYRRAIVGIAPGVSLFGPDTSGSLVFARWGDGYARVQHPAVLTGHHYPLGCMQVPPPSIARLLSLEVRRAEDESLTRYMRIAHRTGIPFRLDETGSVACGGVAGISDTFAATLWAVDYIAHAMRAGVEGINFEGNPARCGGYTPLCAKSARALAEGVLSARPEWYALLAARAMVGERPVPVARTGDLNVDVLATVGKQRLLHVLIVDDDTQPGDDVMSLRLPESYGRVSALSLTATSASARSVRFGPAWWHTTATGGRAISPSSRFEHGRLTVAVARMSALMLTVRATR